MQPVACDVDDDNDRFSDKLVRYQTLESLITYEALLEDAPRYNLSVLFVVNSARDFLPVYSWLANRDSVKEIVLLAPTPNVGHQLFDVIDELEKFVRNTNSLKVVIENPDDYFQSNHKRFDAAFWMTKYPVGQDAVDACRRFSWVLKDRAMGFFSASKDEDGDMVTEFIEDTSSLRDRIESCPTGPVGFNEVIAMYKKVYGETDLHQQMVDFSYGPSSKRKELANIVNGMLALDLKRSNWLLQEPVSNCLASNIYGVSFRLGLEPYSSFFVEDSVGVSFIAHRGSPVQPQRKFEDGFLKNVAPIWMTYIFHDAKKAVMEKAGRLLLKQSGRPAASAPALVASFFSLSMKDALRLIEVVNDQTVQQEKKEWMSSFSIAYDPTISKTQSLGRLLRLG